MFTGLIEDIGKVLDIRSHGASVTLSFESTVIAADLQIGDSVAVNGACLTATSIAGNRFAMDAVPETMRRTTLGLLQRGDPVNLERALKVGSRLGGHFVTGHVDGVGKLLQISREEIASVLTVGCDSALMNHIVEKGSIAIEGVSLTVMDAGESSFRISLIPHSADRTTLSRKQPGSLLNLETDVLAKYLEKWAKPRNGTGISMEMLRENGFV